MYLKIQKKLRKVLNYTVKKYTWNLIYLYRKWLCINGNIKIIT